MTPVRIVLALTIALPGLAAVHAAKAAEIVLITEREAKLPAVGSVELPRSQRAITRGPKVLVVSPAAAGDAIKSPVKLKLKFDSFGGAKIDTDSIKIVYVKNPEVDLTKRVKQFIAEDGKGLELDGARVPPGDHLIKVELKDSDGRPASTSFVLKVTK